jgi:hypothetical protein
MRRATRRRSSSANSHRRPRPQPLPARRHPWSGSRLEVIASGGANPEGSMHVDADHVAARREPQLAFVGFRLCSPLWPTVISSALSCRRPRPRGGWRKCAASGHASVYGWRSGAGGKDDPQIEAIMMGLSIPSTSCSSHRGASCDQDKSWSMRYQCKRHCTARRQAPSALQGSVRRQLVPIVHRHLRRVSDVW